MYCLLLCAQDNADNESAPPGAEQADTLSVFEIDEVGCWPEVLSLHIPALHSTFVQDVRFELADESCILIFTLDYCSSHHCVVFSSFSEKDDCEEEICVAQPAGRWLDVATSYCLSKLFVSFRSV